MKIKFAGRDTGQSRNRHWGKWVVMLAIAVTVMGSTLSIAHADTSYTVQPGDTLTGIAARYNVSVDAIVTANNLPNRSTIYVGQSLVIPSGTGQQQTTQAATGTYVVQTGDTLSSIALRYGTTTAALELANKLASSVIYVGQTLTIVPASYTAPAAPTSIPASGGTYTVLPGDSLSSVAAKFGVARADLAAANGMSPSAYLYVGQVLTIPGAGQQVQAPTPTSVPPTATTVPPTAQVPVADTTTPQPVVVPTQAAPGTPVQYTVQAGDTMSSIAAKFNTTVTNLQSLNNLGNTNYIYVGQVLVIVKGNDQGGAPPTVQPTAGVPAEPTPPVGKYGPKWVDVDLTTQTMVAYEGETTVYTARVSSGTWDHPTVLGTYRVYAKYVTTRMRGGEGAEKYDIPDVPYTMYFYADYALHGAYWHNNFGNPMSHGCVNLPVDVAKWMYDWAPIGTMVVTHN
jgi:LysM repeat protein